MTLGDGLMWLLLLLSIFLMLVVLIQRGRGGGLAGAFGGLGGQSAFGTKAGDVFTVITVVTAVLWVTVACLAGWRLRVESQGFYTGRDEVNTEEMVPPGAAIEGEEPDDATKPDAKDGPVLESTEVDGEQNDSKAGADSTKPGARAPATGGEPANDSAPEQKDAP